MATDAKVEPFKSIQKRIESAIAADADASEYWLDYLAEEEVSILNDVVQEWLDGAEIEVDEQDHLSEPTNPYNVAWHLLFQVGYDTDGINFEFVEGLRPGDSGRYIFLRMASKRQTKSVTVKTSV